MFISAILWYPQRPVTNRRTGSGREQGTVLHGDVGAVLSGRDMYLRTEARGLGQAPLAARCPVTVVDQTGVDGLAHDRLQFVAGLERLVAGKVNGHRKVHQGHAA